MECKFINSSKLYDEILDFLLSCKVNENEIKKLQIQMPNAYINQILSLLNIN